MGLAILAAIIGAGAAALITWLALRGRLATLVERSTRLQQDAEAASYDARRLNDLNIDLRAQLAGAQATLELEKKSAAEKLSLLEEARQKLSDAFQALSAEALKSNNQAFLELARTRLETFQQQAKSDLEERRTAVETLVTPLKEALGKVDTQLHALEVERKGAYAGLVQQVQMLTEGQSALKSETANLVRALRQPKSAGNWGEIQLRRVIEIAGMVEHCDFEEQVSVATDDGRLRPDALVRLPGGKHLIIDAKAPLKPLLDAYEAQTEEARNQHLADLARVIRDHMDNLSGKKYWAQFSPAPEFVVMFLPGEALFSAAWHEDPELVERGIARNVIVASPTTLIALLRAIAYGWQQEQLKENAQKISDAGRELYERLSTMGQHFAKTGDSLHKAVDAYNKTVGSLESRVLVSARKLKELGGYAGEIAELEPVDSTPRPVEAEELKSLGAASGE
jgi:DNA recombination protein RmuC